MNDFGRGAMWAFRGIGEFFRHPRLWRFVVIPLIPVLAVYGWLFHMVRRAWLPQLLAATQNFFADSWFGFLCRSAEVLITVGVYLFFVIVTACFAGNLFEVLGSFFFSRMVRDYEIGVLECKIEKIPFAREVENLLACGVFSSITLLLCVVFFIAGFFLPFIAQPVMILFVGYRYAVIYTSEAVFNAGHRLGDVAILYRGRRGLLYGFGAVAFLVFLVPLLPIFLIPGLVIGGTLMYHHRLD